VSFENLQAETIGEIQVESKVLVIKQTIHLAADEGDHETIERGCSRSTPTAVRWRLP